MEMYGRISVLLLSIIAASAQLPSPEIMALLEFKNSISHDPTGYILDSWREESIDFDGCPSSWNGIMCSGGGVAGVVLDGHGLAGAGRLAVLANLTALFKLSISGNSLSGSLPDNLADFQRLRYLDISDNLFSGELPVGIGQLKSLQNLSLAGNNFSGTVPESIGGLVSIQSLDLSRNSLSGPLPLALKELRNLISLNLSFNAFTKGIPSGLEVLENFESIDLSWNQLDGSVDWNFLMNSRVSHVDWSGNLLMTSGPKDMKFLSAIPETPKYLNLSNNKLTGSLVDGDGLSIFGSWRVLDLSYNQLSGDLPGFDYAYDLEVLRLGNNGFSGFLPNGLLNGDSLALTELDLSANNLSGPMSWITSTTLRVLNLSSNAISGDLPLLTGSCTRLDLSNNQFTGNLSVIAKWSDIEYIDLSQNQLKGSFPDVTSQFLRLNYFNLSHNSLTGTLPEVLVHYPKLTVLDLSFNQFDGPILVDLLTSSILLELYLQNNYFEGSIVFSPSVSKNPSLQIIDLSGNHFNGSLPDDLGSLTGLQKLNISANNFSGPLSPTITKLIFLTSLDISLNQFTGPLPATLPDTLISFNASYNDLSGLVPVNLRKFPDSSFHPGNPRLQFPGGAPGTGNIPSGNLSHKRIRTCIKAVIIAACFVAALFLILLAIIVYYKRISRRSPTDKVTDKNVQRRTLSDTSGFQCSSSEIVSLDEKMAPVAGYLPSKHSRFSWSPDSGDIYAHEILGRLDVRLPDQLAAPYRLSGDLYFLDETITVTPEELSRAPAELLGRSSHGTSYRVTLENGVVLTVKLLREGVTKPKKEFSKEANKFANIRHPNVVGLLGYYCGPSQHEKLILSDYISPGSLASFLYDRPGRKGPPLTWDQRLMIAIDVARGLNYLHLERAIPHGNLKATNILLEGLDLNARVADYCLHCLMTPAGTVDQTLDSGVLGYCAPELAASKKPTPCFESDVFAFGVVLLELLTGRCAGDVISGEEGGVDLIDWVRLRVAEGRGWDCFDSAIVPDMANAAAPKRMKEMLRIALRCIRLVSERPGIKSVYEDLSSI